ncbi:MAG: PEP-CTERM sorting domain-containing protein [Candidatus Limnocylindria bacterium]
MPGTWLAFGTATGFGVHRRRRPVRLHRQQESTFADDGRWDGVHLDNQSPMQTVAHPEALPG